MFQVPQWTQKAEQPDARVHGARSSGSNPVGAAPKRARPQGADHSDDGARLHLKDGLGRLGNHRRLQLQRRRH